METDVVIGGQSLIVEFEIKITAHGHPATGPTYSSGGEPAEAAEFEVAVYGARFPKQHADVPELELPQWLKDLLETHLMERDDINDIAQRMDYEDSGPDPDYERDLRAEDRELASRYPDVDD